MEYDIHTFTNRLKEYFLESPLFPYMYGEYMSSWCVMQNSEQKHKRNPPHLKDMAKLCIEETMQDIDENMISFDYGNEQMEKYYPYYHILQQAQVIRKRNKGTDRTKGSQDKVENKANRDYEKVSWNGKIYSKEYTKKVRNNRKQLESVSHWTIGGNGQKEWVNRDSNSYNNIHYRYIDNILNEDVIMKLAQEFGMKVSVRNTGLEEEYYNQEMTDILDILNSHGG